jgi:hypothetical protein
MKKITGAPQWLKDRMKRLRELPPPTLEEVEKQLKASAEWDFDCIKEIKKSKVIR